MDTRQIEYVLAIAEEKNMTRAAQKLYISQPTLSQALAKLEQELGQPLFIRNHNEMLPTVAGQDYIYTGTQILKLKRQLYGKLQNHSAQNVLTVGVSSHLAAAMISHVLAEFQEKSLETGKGKFSLKVLNESPSGLMEKIWKKTLDLAIITADTPGQQPGAEVLYQEEILLAIPQKYSEMFALGEGSPEHIAALLQEHTLPFILAERETALRKISDAYLLSLAVVPDIVCEMRDMADALLMCADGIGLTFLPESRKNTDLPVQYFSLLPRLYRYQILMLQNGILRKNPVCQDFLDILKKHVSKDGLCGKSE